MYILVAIFAMPVLLYVIAGAYALWETRLWIYLWWVLPFCWLLTYLVGRFWAAPATQDAEQPDATHWTPRDRDAAKIVLQYQQDVGAFSAKEMTDLHFYVKKFEALSNELASHYHPDAADPFSSLTIPELAAAVRLVADDLEQLVLQSLPGSQLLTVKQWRSFGDTPKWLSRAKNTVWASSILINPLNIVRYGLSKTTVDKVSSGIQSEVLASIYLRFIRQVGFYLIEMNSGRLRGGADVYREAFEKNNHLLTDQDEEQSQKIESITIGLIGQSGAGKSSLVNCMTHNSGATIDVLKGTSHVKRHCITLHSDDSASPLNAVLLDSPGYEDAETPNRRWKEIKTVFAQSDVVLLTINANAVDRSIDVAAFERLTEKYTAAPNLKPPPVIAVITNIDLVSPPLEWSPPYDFEHPINEKEHSIAQAIEQVRNTFNDFVVDIAPVSSGKILQRTWGINEFLTPAIQRQLAEGKSVAILAAFEAGLNRGWAKKVFRQFAHGGKQLAKIWLQEKKNRRTQE